MRAVVDQASELVLDTKGLKIESVHVETAEGKKNLEVKKPFCL